jgi:hypothetical protein
MHLHKHFLPVSYNIQEAFCQILYQMPDWNYIGFCNNTENNYTKKKQAAIFINRLINCRVFSERIEKEM